MDELDIYWHGHFGVAASTFERRLLAQIMTVIPPGDPLFVVTAMLARQIYVVLGSNEKAILEFGPTVTKRMEDLKDATEKIAVDLDMILVRIALVNGNIEMLDARVTDRRRSLAQWLTERTIAIINDESKTTLQWTVSLCLAFIAGVAAVSVLSAHAT
jgi:hypothetical protein